MFQLLVDCFPQPSYICPPRQQTFIKSSTVSLVKYWMFSMWVYVGLMSELIVTKWSTRDEMMLSQTLIAVLSGRPSVPMCLQHSPAVTQLPGRASTEAVDTQDPVPVRAEHTNSSRQSTVLGHRERTWFSNSTSTCLWRGWRHWHLVDTLKTTTHPECQQQDGWGEGVLQYILGVYP